MRPTGVALLDGVKFFLRILLLQSNALQMNNEPVHLLRVGLCQIRIRLFSDLGPLLFLLVDEGLKELDALGLIPVPRSSWCREPLLLILADIIDDLLSGFSRFREATTL
jgi:hypothetical protein